MPSIQLANSRSLRAALAATAMFAVAALARAGVAPDPAVEVVSVGVFTVAPYIVAGADGPTGALIDFFDREVAPRMGVRFKWERPMTTARLEQSLANGSVMFTPILARTLGREQARIRYADAAYVHFAPCIALLAADPLLVLRSPADLAGKTVGWVQAGALPPFMLDSRIQLDRIGSIDWTEANLEKLKLGRIDAAYFSNHYTPEYFAARSGIAIKLLPLPVEEIALFGAFSPKVPVTLAERYQRAARAAFAGDKFDAYLRKAVAGD